PRRELLEQNTPATSNSVMTDVWRGCYIMINRANSVITKAPGVTDNTALRDRIVAEAKFLRAWAYFELVSQWGAVPLYSEPVTSASGFKPKSTVDELYTFIIKDLNEASAALPATYDNANRGRATSHAANALLGRVQMQKGDYAAAKTALQKIVASGQFRLVNNYLDNFLEETEFNQESIFEVVFYDRGDNNFNWGGYSTGDGAAVPVSTVRNQEYCPIAWRNLIPSNKYLNEFEANDPRLRASIYMTGDLYNNGTSTLTDAEQNGNSSVLNGVTLKISWRKFMLIYKSNNTFQPGGINQRLIRYADVLLMLAECEIEANAFAAAAALINQVRARQSVNMPPIATPANKNDALRALMHERMVELGGEEVRNIDMLRWRKKGYYPSVVPEPKPGQVDMLPIPFAETSANPNL
ncbi:MAG TPA: RagB/SusD family nutrient uptake outer membrane protein, partial [Phnomibacter sp.]|nr:RagB/SusD family nutrient uptake outer membrane protein [Phnomibacter sp.]